MISEKSNHKNPPCGTDLYIGPPGGFSAVTQGCGYAGLRFCMQTAFPVQISAEPPPCSRGFVGGEQTLCPITVYADVMAFLRRIPKRRRPSPSFSIPCFCPAFQSNRRTKLYIFRPNAAYTGDSRVMIPPAYKPASLLPACARRGAVLPPSRASSDAIRSADIRRDVLLKCVYGCNRPEG